MYANVVKYITLENNLRKAQVSLSLKHVCGNQVFLQIEDDLTLLWHTVYFPQKINILNNLSLLKVILSNFKVQQKH